MLSVEDSVTHYTLSRHPRNRAIIDITNKKTSQLQFIKIRHRLANFYAVSLVDPKSFNAWAETQVKSASTKLKPITLQGYKQSIPLKDTSIFGFEWSFEWEDQKFKWVREGPMKASLECRAIRGRGNDICIAQYLPKGVKNEYFGLISILGYNFLRCQIKDQQAMELLLLISLMTILDKSDDTNWKKETSQGTLFLTPNEVPSIQHHEHQQHNREIKEQQQKVKSEREIEQRLQDMLEKEVKRSQKQIKRQSGQVYAASSSSVTSSPFDSPHPSPTNSSHNLNQKQLDYLSQMLSSTLKHSNDATATLPTYLVQQTGHHHHTITTNQYRSIQTITDFRRPSHRPHATRRLSSIDHLQIKNNRIVIFIITNSYYNILTLLMYRQIIVIDIQLPSLQALYSTPSATIGDKENLFLNEATISESLQVPLSPMVALGYILIKQAVSIFDLEYKDDPTVHMLYEIAHSSHDNEIHNEEKTMDVLMTLCRNHCDRYKRILEAIGEDHDDKKRAKVYAEDGLLYSETCVKKYSQQLPLSTMPKPSEILPSIVLKHRYKLFTKPITVH
ncbi:hypothetical protein BJ944DRAFT_230056 [Cunninghamella echinulata]|nr:hypothetical protein BJ944DRAFT_230056 [Cunninghamella echinulata]